MATVPILVSFKPSVDDIGEIYDIRMNCPICNNTLVCTNISIDVEHDDRFICSICLSRFNFKNWDIKEPYLAHCILNDGINGPF